MTGTVQGSAPPLSRISLLVALALLLPVALVLALAADLGPLPWALGGAAALWVLSLIDIRTTFVVAVLLASFVDYTTGQITLQLSVLCAWLAWTFLLLLWRSAWTGWVSPPAGVVPGIACWCTVCAFGVLLGLLRGNSLRSLGVELAGALWPLLALGVMQIYGRRTLAYVGLGLCAVAFAHTVFGLTMLQIYRHRLGGIYFMTITGMVAVGLWTAALITPKRRTRILCLLGIVPLLAHLLFSFTRGYWLAFVAGIGVASVLAWHSLGRFEPARRVGRLLLVPVLAGLAALTVGLSTLYFGQGDLMEAVGRRFGSSFSTDLGGETLSNVIRLMEYERAIEAAMESPVIGNGLGYAIVTRDLLTGTIREQWFVHNYYLLTWLKLGVLGLAAFLFLIWTLIRSARRIADEDPSWLVRAWAIAAIAITCQVLVILITNYSLAEVNTGFVLALVWGALWGARATRGRSRVSAKGSS